MKIDLTDTTASKINKALVQGRRAIGTPAVGMVLTLVIVTDEENAYDALKAANDASHEHPSRTLVVIKRVSRSPRDRTQSRLDAEVRVGADAGSGETVVLRLYGEVSDHAQSVVLPLLLPDAPVVVWWPVNAPLDPAKDPLGALAQRRVTDTYASEQPVRELSARADTYTPGDTDLSWTRITPWRSMLAAALDQVVCEVKAVEVEGEEFNPSCELLAMWLADRLDVPVKRSLSSGPGLTAVRMDTDCGPITLDRADGSLATLSIQGQPNRAVALKRRETAELIAEELRRLDPDDTYASALRFGVERLNSGLASAVRGAGAAEAAEAAVAKAVQAVALAEAAVARAEESPSGGAEDSEASGGGDPEASGGGDPEASVAGDPEASGVADSQASGVGEGSSAPAKGAAVGTPAELAAKAAAKAQEPVTKAAAK
ncbi:glucose-6-phosphate dehydrogenase assembly protein OpcA [Streptomyces sp. NPDC057740]|uniref:glucose-6-phosphate dehydrogenase assembly protein OpcA n=1 Tax=Streptomyces sp. NPDC057740 TaxID=3346234 RepID=UPI003691BE93